MNLVIPMHSNLLWNTIPVQQHLLHLYMPATFSFEIIFIYFFYSQTCESRSYVSHDWSCLAFSFPLVAVVCAVLSPPENGFFVQNMCNNQYNSACGMRCLPGFELQGSSIRLCQADGTWSGAPPTCAGEAVDTNSILRQWNTAWIFTLAWYLCWYGHLW